MNLELNVVRFENEDVIATSCELTGDVYRAGALNNNNRTFNLAKDLTPGQQSQTTLTVHKNTNSTIDNGDMDADVFNTIVEGNYYHVTEKWTGNYSGYVKSFVSCEDVNSHSDNN